MFRTAVAGHAQGWNPVTVTAFIASFCVAGPGRWAGGEWPEFGPAIQVTRRRVRTARRVALVLGIAVIAQFVVSVGVATTSSANTLSDVIWAGMALTSTALSVLGAIQHGLGMRYVFGDEALRLLYDESLQYPEQPHSGRTA